MNGTVITDTQVTQNMPLLQFLAAASNSVCGQSGPGLSPQSADVAKACSRQTLSFLIQEILMKTYATQHHITVPASQVTAEVDKLKSQIGGSTAFENMLKQQHMDDTRFNGLVGRLLLFQAVQNDLAATLVTDAQVQQAYSQNQSQYTQIHVAHILVKSKAQAEKIKKQATTKNFAALAKKYSIDTQSASKGGDLGTAPASQFVSEFSNAVLAAKPGQIIGPVQSQFGWHVIWVKSIAVQPLDQVKTQIQQTLSTSAFAKWLVDRINSSKITINPRYGKMDPVTGQVVAITSTSTTAPVVVPTSPAGASPTP